MGVGIKKGSCLMKDKHHPVTQNCVRAEEISDSSPNIFCQCLSLAKSMWNSNDQLYLEMLLLVIQRRAGGEGESGQWILKNREMSGT